MKTASVVLAMAVCGLSAYGETPAPEAVGGKPSFAISSKVSVSVPDKAIEKSFWVAANDVAGVRRAAYNYYQRDGWLAISAGKAPRPTYDPRDCRYGPKCAAYLWGDDPSLIPEMGNRIFLDQHDREGNLAWEWGANGQCAIHIAQIAKQFSDYLRYSERDDFIKANWDRQLKILKSALSRYDRDSDGLIEQGEQVADHLWAYLVGEPLNSFALDRTQNDVVVVASMEVCEWLQLLAAYGEAHQLPETDWLKAKAAQSHHAIETLAYDMDANYYYLLRRAAENRWYHSGGGINEDSRELDVTSYYAAFVSGNYSRGKHVATYARHVLMDRNIFPMPLFYPVYYWVCPYFEYHYYVEGECWGESYYNCVRAFAKYGMFDAVYAAIKRRSEAHVRDDHCSEWYGTDGTAKGSDHYGISAAAHVSVIIEGLFGITPTRFGFNEVNVWPAIPTSWADQPATLCVTLPDGGFLKYTHLNDKKARTVVLTIETNRTRVGHFRVPAPGSIKSVTWNGERILCDVASQDDLQTDIAMFARPFEKAVLEIEY